MRPLLYSRLCCNTPVFCLPVSRQCPPCGITHHPTPTKENRRAISCTSGLIIGNPAHLMRFWRRRRSELAGCSSTSSLPRIFHASTAELRVTVRQQQGSGAHTSGKSVCRIAHDAQQVRQGREVSLNWLGLLRWFPGSACAGSVSAVTGFGCHLDFLQKVKKGF